MKKSAAIICVRKRSTAFTLVELLVVIVIIAILAALLLPAISRVRQLAKRSQCQSALHQCDIALQAHCYPPKNVYPDHFKHLHDDGSLTPEIFICPGDLWRVGNDYAADTVGNIGALNSSYLYHKSLPASVPPGTMIMCDKDVSYHEGEGYNALDAGHTTTWYPTNAVPANPPGGGSNVWAQF